MTRLFILIGATLSFGPTAAFGQAASLWPEADRIFHSDSRWLGSDGGFSIDLGNGRVLWSFGDTLVVKKAGDTRKAAAFVHNTVAIEAGYDPSTAQMKYYWRRWGSRMEIFPSDGKVWMWPSHGIRIDNRLVVFCSRVQNNPKKDFLDSYPLVMRLPVFLVRPLLRVLFRAPFRRRRHAVNRLIQNGGYAHRLAGAGIQFLRRKGDG